AMFNVMFNKTFTDLYSCYVLFRRRLIIADELQTEGWEQQAEILALVVRRSRTHYEVPIAYHGRTYDEGKKIRAHHAFSVMWTIVRTWFRAAAWKRRSPLRTRAANGTPRGRPRG